MLRNVLSAKDVRAILRVRLPATDLTFALTAQRRWKSDFDVPGFRYIPAIDDKKPRRRPRISKGVSPEIDQALAAAEEENEGRKIRMIPVRTPMLLGYRQLSLTEDSPPERKHDEPDTKSRSSKKAHALVRKIRSSPSPPGKAKQVTNVPRNLNKDASYIFQERPAIGIKLRSGDQAFLCPWLGDRPTFAATGLQQLKNELLALESFVSPSIEEEAAADSIIAQVKDSLQPQYEAVVIGSRKTGLAFPTSDLDFYIPALDQGKLAGERGPSPNRPKAVKARRNALRSIASQLEKDERFRSVLIIHAKVDLVSALHRDTNLEIQIQGSRNNADSHEYVKHYISEFPTITGLHKLMKILLGAYNLNVVFHGGLGAYSLFMMIAASLKIHEASCDRYDIGQQLRDFLKMYATHDFTNTGITVEPPGFFEKTDKPDAHLADDLDAPSWHLGQLAISKKPGDQLLMCLQDPADPWNDLGRKTFRIIEIQALFKKWSGRLEGSLESWPYRQADRSILGTLVGGDYTSFERQRQKIRSSISQALPKIKSKT